MLALGAIRGKVEFQSAREFLMDLAILEMTMMGTVITGEP